ncbi:hypothetical protein P8452_26483 [Trifolium repens]|nr:hypothetical protein P8452_26483 [Trifolium repens]
MTINRRSLSEAQKKVYINHRKVRYIMIEAIPYSEYIKLTDTSTAKAVYDSLCATYEEDEPKKESKSLTLKSSDRIIKDEYSEEDSDVEEIETLELHYPDKEKRLYKKIGLKVQVQEKGRMDRRTATTIQKSFDLYKDISDGLGVVLDNFFNLPLSACVTAFNACVKSYKQFDELSAFYSFCLSIGIGRSYEYPTVQKVSEELMETLQAFLKDQASFHTINNNGSKHFIVSGHKNSNSNASCSSSSQNDLGIERCGTLERFFENGSEFGSQCTSLEDLMSATDVAGSSRDSLEHDTCSEESDENEKQSSQYYDDEFTSANGSCSTRSFSIGHNSRSSLDIISVDDLHHDQVLQHNHQTNEREKLQNIKGGSNSNDSSKDCWEIVLAKTVVSTDETPSPKLDNGIDPFLNLFDQALVPQQKYNPFLDDVGTLDPHHATTSASFDDIFDVSLSPTFKATTSPTFKATTSPTFKAHDPLALTVSNQNSNTSTNLDLIFGDIYPNDTTMAPSFEAQNSLQMIVAPSFEAQNSFKNVSTPTFQVHNSNDNAIVESPIYTVENPNTSIVPFDPYSNFFDSTVAPTFSANVGTKRESKCQEEKILGS